MTIKQLVRYGLALLTGMLLTLAFAPFNIYPFAILSTTLLLGLWLNVSAKQAFWRGYLFGIGLFGSGVYWIFISIHTYGNTYGIVAFLITCAFIALLALFPAFTGYLLNRFFPRSHFTKYVCAFPAIWILLEWVRSWLFSGFPWLMIGYSQINSPLRGYAPLLSVYGVSLATLMTSGLLLSAILHCKKKYFKTFSLYLLSILLIWAIGSYLDTKVWTQPYGKPIKVSLVQGNIAQDLKWSPDHTKSTLDQYVKMTKAHWDSKIIIWPETAIPIPLHVAMDFLEKLSNDANKHKAALITGIPAKANDKEGYYNAVITLGKGEGSYLKRRLVPFGEFVPLMHSIVGRFFDLLNVPMSDFIPGDKTLQPIVAHGIKISTFICYEIAFPEQVLSHDESINMLLTVSNDAWFGHSIAQAQHAQIAQMRALEMGRPVLFASNDGITAIINARGTIQSIAPQHEAFVLTDVVQPTQGHTPWQKSAMDPLLGITIALLIIAIRRRNN